MAQFHVQYVKRVRGENGDASTKRDSCQSIPLWPKVPFFFFLLGRGGRGGGVLNFNNSSSTILCNEIYGLDCLLFTQDYVLPLLGLEYILITFIDYMQYRLTPDIRSKECVTVPRGLKQLAGYILAFPILQVKMWIEVDEDPLVGAGGRDHPRTTLRGGVRHGVPGRGEVVGIWDPDVASTFVCKTWSHHDLKHVLAHTNRSLIDHILYRNWDMFSLQAKLLSHHVKMDLKESEPFHVAYRKLTSCKMQGWNFF